MPVPNGLGRRPHFQNPPVSERGWKKKPGTGKGTRLLHTSSPLKRGDRGDFETGYQGRCWQLTLDTQRVFLYVPIQNREFLAFIRWIALKPIQSFVNGSSQVLLPHPPDSLL
jgi:hypothetical protein